MKLPDEFLLAVVDEFREINIYLENVRKFLMGFGYSVTIESNGTVKIQSQELDFHDYERKYSEYGEEDTKHGNWYDVGSLSCRCSQCGCKNNKETRYCPNCGAKMEDINND